jgi:hypothetical protein
VSAILSPHLPVPALLGYSCKLARSQALSKEREEGEGRYGTPASSYHDQKSGLAEIYLRFDITDTDLGGGQEKRKSERISFSSTTVLCYECVSKLRACQ